MTAPTRLYRWYDTDGTLLYIGIAGDPVGRSREHLKESRWIRWASRMEIDPTVYGTRREATDAEAEAIALERPIFNVVNAAGYNARTSAYLAARGEAPRVSHTALVQATERPGSDLNPADHLGAKGGTLLRQARAGMSRMESAVDPLEIFDAADAMLGLVLSLQQEAFDFRALVATEARERGGLSFARLGALFGVSRTMAQRLFLRGLRIRDARTATPDTEETP